MPDNPFEAPVHGDPSDDFVRASARRALHKAAVLAVLLGLFQFCCNPCWLITVACATASLSALRMPNEMRVNLDEDYPAGAGAVATAGGAVGLALVALRVALGVLMMAVRVGRLFPEGAGP